MLHKRLLFLDDTLIHFFLLTFNLPLQSSLDYHITSLKRIKINDLMVIEVVG